MRPLLSGIRVCAGCALLAAMAGPAGAFPPYRSTDAATAGAGALELRVGLTRIRRIDSRTQRSAPLTRTNLGVGTRFEVISELEYSADEDRWEEGALGFKWARLEDGLGIGVETLVLLPLQPDQSGAGIESQFLTTLRGDRAQVHVNIGAFHDPRGSETARGLRASVLAELSRERLRPGIEVFAKSVEPSGTAVQLGFGAIARFPRFELRSGLHFGLTDDAPDLEASLWVARSWQVRSR